VLDFFESVDDGRSVADQGRTLARVLHGDVGPNASRVEQRHAYARTKRKEVAQSQREIAELSGLPAGRAGQEKARKQVRFRLSDTSRRRRQLGFGAPD